MTSEREATDDKPHHVQGTSAIEWLAAAVGALLLVGMIGYMTVLGFKETEGTPLITLTAVETIHRGDSYIVKFEVKNLGDQTASALVVRAVLTQNESEIETSELTIDYLPSRSVQYGGFFLRHDPKLYHLELIPVGYLDP